MNPNAIPAATPDPTTPAAAPTMPSFGGFNPADMVTQATGGQTIGVNTTLIVIIGVVIVGFFMMRLGIKVLGNADGGDVSKAGRQSIVASIGTAWVVLAVFAPFILAGAAYLLYSLVKLG